MRYSNQESDNQESENQESENQGQVLYSLVASAYYLGHKYLPPWSQVGHVVGFRSLFRCGVVFGA